MPFLPQTIQKALALADPSWLPVLERGLDALQSADPAYLPELAETIFLPTEGRLFAAFRQPLEKVRYVLVGEGPYPRADSATGVCFMDGTVHELWSQNGLSRQVNRATSLRNFIKMLLVADGILEEDATTGPPLAHAASLALAPGSQFIRTREELQGNLEGHGFLLLNASLVFRGNVAPQKDARAWRPFLSQVMDALARVPHPPQLVLWGKIAGQLQGIEGVQRLPSVGSEHPYNLSFIRNPVMQSFFRPMRLLSRESCRRSCDSP